MNDEYDQNMPQDTREIERDTEQDIRPNGLEPDPQEDRWQQPGRNKNLPQEAAFGDARSLPQWPEDDVLQQVSGKESRLGRNWPDAPPLGLLGRRPFKARVLGVVLVLGLLGAGGWYFIGHSSKPKRLPGMDLLEPPARAVAKVVQRAAQPKAVAQPPAAQATVAPDLGQSAGGMAAPASVRVSGQAPASQPASGPDLAVALAAPAASTAVSALPDALPAPVAALPAASSAIAGTSSATVQALQQRMDKLEDALAIVQLAQSRLEQESDDRRAAPAPQASPNRHEPPARSRPKAVLAAASAPQPKLGAQLLSVDMWGGSSSVVVTSGLPGDTRTRTLRPGESLNGVTLRSADPATGQATFVSDGHVFTLSLRDGG